MFCEDLSYASIDASETVSLSPTQIAKAATLSTLVCQPQQWPTYLNALAWAGTQSWFQYRSPDLKLESEASVLNKPALMNLVSAVGPIRVNGFSFTIIASALMAESLRLPQGMVEIPHLTTHFYLWVEVREEDSEVRIAGVLRHEQLHKLSASLKRTDQWQYDIPTTVFSTDTGGFLRLLQCGTPGMIPLDFAKPSPIEPQAIESLLQPLISLQSSNQAPWEILSWSQAQILLNNSPLNHWLTSAWPSVAIAQHNLQQRLARLLTPVINAAQWLDTTVGAMASDWTPVPQFQVSGLRGATSQRDELLKALNIEFTREAQAIIREVSVGTQPVQLYAIAQPEPMQYGLPHWSLCVIISALDDMRLPQGMQMHLTDSADLHLTQTVNGENPECYLYIQVMGTWMERFWVTVTVPGSPVLELEPLAWQPA